MFSDYQVASKSLQEKSDSLWPTLFVYNFALCATRTVPCFSPLCRARRGDVPVALSSQRPGEVPHFMPRCEYYHGIYQLETVTSVTIATPAASTPPRRQSRDAEFCTISIGGDLGAWIVQGCCVNLRLTLSPFKDTSRSRTTIQHSCLLHWRADLA